MAYAPAAIAPRDIAISQPATRRRGLMSRLLDAMMAARMRQAEREIAAYRRRRRTAASRTKPSAKSSAVSCPPRTSFDAFKGEPKCRSSKPAPR